MPLRYGECEMPLGQGGCEMPLGQGGVGDATGPGGSVKYNSPWGVGDATALTVRYSMISIPCSPIHYDQHTLQHDAI